MYWSVSAVAFLALGAAAKVRLDTETDQQLLLNGRPQIGLWQSLLREAKDKAALQALTYV